MGLGGSRIQISNFPVHNLLDYRESKCAQLPQNAIKVCESKAVKLEVSQTSPGTLWIFIRYMCQILVAMFLMLLLEAERKFHFLE